MNFNRRIVFTLTACGTLLLLQSADGKPNTRGTVAPDNPTVTTRTPDRKLSKPTQTKATIRSVSNSVPSDYTQVGNTELFCRSNQNFDFIGRIGDEYYGSTYNNGGYKICIQVNNGTARQIGCNMSTDIEGVLCTPRVEQQGELARVVYSVENTTDTDAVVSLGTHADVMIGNNDRAPITRRIDMLGATYGVTMKDNGAAQLCVLFGSGLAGVNGVDDFWFGQYNQNYSADAMVGNYAPGGYWMQENGNYDSGMGWCWKNRTIPAGQTVEFSYLIGVGDVNLEPTSSFVATVDNPDLWNDLSLPHELTISGEYESPAGQNGLIEYSVEDSEEWLPLTEELTSGSEFSSTITIMFDASRPNHVVRFRTVDNVGNASTLNPIVFRDISQYILSNITDMVYDFGNELKQQEIHCALPAEQYRITGYTDNRNVGTAYFFMEGVFPYTIGRRKYHFSIAPLPLTGEIIVDEELKYTGEFQYPTKWHWSDTRFANLERDKDFYYTGISGCKYPGTSRFGICGRDNFTGMITCDFTILKNTPDDKSYQLTIPESIHYDGQPHPAVVVPGYGCGTPTLTYRLDNGEENAPTTQAPVMPGSYDIYLSLTEGEFYTAMEASLAGSMTIYPLNEEDYAALMQLTRDLIAQDATLPWNDNVTALDLPGIDRIQLSEGNITGLNLSDCNISGEMPASLSGLKNLQSLNLSDNRLTGNVTPIAESLPALTSLDVSRNRFSDIYPPLPERITQRNIAPQDIEATVEIDLATDNSESIIVKMPRIATYNSNTNDTQSYLDIITLHLKSGDWECDMTTWPDANGGLGFSAIDGKNIYAGHADDEIEAEVRGRVSLKAKIGFPRGDANFNGTVDIADLQSMVNYILGAYSGKYLYGDYYYRWRYATFNHTAANLWDDAIINVQDMVALTNMLVTAPARSSRRLRSLPETETDSHPARVFCRDGHLFIDSNTPVAAFDITIMGTTDVKLVDNLSEAGFTMVSTTRDGVTHIIGYSLSGAEIPTGTTPVAHVGNDAKASGATLSDTYAELIPCTTDTHTMTDGILHDNVVSARANGPEIHVVSPHQYDSCKWAIYSTDGRTLAAGDSPLVAGDNTIAIIDRRLAIVTIDVNGQRSVFKVTTK